MKPDGSSGSAMRGGAGSRGRFARLLGIRPPFRVADVTSAAGRIEVSVALPDGGLAQLSILRAEQGVDALVATGDILVRHQGRDGLPEALSRDVSRSVSTRLTAVTIERLAALVHEDPESGPATSAQPGGALHGRSAAGGSHSIRRFTWLLGLEGTTARVDAVAWVADHVEIGVDVGAQRPVRFAITQRQPGSRGIVVTPHLVVSYEAKGLPQEVSVPVVRLCPARLAGTTLDGLAAIMAEDPQLGDPGLPSPPAARAHPANLVDSWGAPDACFDFFAGGEIARGKLDSISFGRCLRNVQHCDMECMLVSPHMGTETVTLLDYPWERRGGRARGSGPGGGRPCEDDEPMLATDLVDDDVTLGSSEKLRRVLDHAIGRPNPEGKPLFVASTCVPAVTGEDVESVVREYRKRYEHPLLYLTVSPGSMSDLFVDLLVTRRLAAEAAAGPPDPLLVNLIGFPEEAAGEDLSPGLGQLLGRSGIRVNQVLLPDIDPRRVALLPRAALNVFCPNRLWSHLYEQLQRDTRTDCIFPPAPYGLARTRQWLAAIAGRLGAAAPEESEYDEAAFRRAAARARGHRLGLVVRGEETHYLTDPAETWGIPVTELCEEAGFTLEILLHAPSPEAARRAVARARTALREPYRHKIDTFASFDEMRRALRESRCAAILSNHFFDWRISEAGKSRFSLQFFEMGLGGAARTVERLVETCEVPFYHRYGRYLRRDADGLRGWS